jgi:hypothetical protein
VHPLDDANARSVHLPEASSVIEATAHSMSTATELVAFNSHYCSHHCNLIGFTE